MKVLRKETLNGRESHEIYKQERPELGETDTGLPGGGPMNKGLLLGSPHEGFYGLEGP